MKKFALVVVVFSAFALSACGGPSCKKVLCSPSCDILTQYCDGVAGSPTCQTYKTCTPACTSPMFCDVTKGSCASLPMACTPACGTGMYCDNGTCKTTPVVPVCSPACTGAGEACVN